MHQLNPILIVFLYVIGSFVLYHYVTNYKFSFNFLEPCDPGFSCTELYFQGNASFGSSTLAKVMKEVIFIRPPKHAVYQGYDIYAPVWNKLEGWYKVQQNLRDVFFDQPPGVFVEIGAVDGDFMSQTIYLEKNLSWTGLLIEPDPRSFKILKEAGRNAWLTSLCVGPFGMTKFWLRSLEKGLPNHFQQILMAKSKVFTETLEGAEEHGSVISVPCMSLSLMLKALEMKTVDLLTISTGEEFKDKIYDAIYSKSIDVKMLLIYYPTNSIRENPYPLIEGYMLDVQRSQMHVKFYFKMSHCSLLTTDDCIKTQNFNKVEACYTYYCFDYLTVKTFNPAFKFSIKEKPIQ